MIPDSFIIYSKLHVNKDKLGTSLIYSHCFKTCKHMHDIGINYDCFITQLTVILMLYITITNFFILHYSNKTRNATFENLSESVFSEGSLHTE